MRPRRVPSSTTVFSLPGGNEDNDLWLEATADQQGVPVLRSVWVPSAAERAQLAAGANVQLAVWGSGHPPVAVGVTDEQPGKASA